MSVQTEREAFEAWVLLNRTRYPEETLDLTEGMNNDYPHSRWIQMDWEVWQARASQVAAPPVLPASQPIYQVKSTRRGAVFWCDTDKGNHDAFPAADRRLCYATPQPAEQTALSDADLEALWNDLDGKAIIQGVSQGDWNRALRIAYARAVLAAAKSQQALNDLTHQAQALGMYDDAGGERK